MYGSEGVRSNAREEEKKKETYLGSVCLWYVVNWSTALTGL